MAEPISTVAPLCAFRRALPPWWSLWPWVMTICWISSSTTPAWRSRASVSSMQSRWLVSMMVGPRLPHKMVLLLLNQPRWMKVISGGRGVVVVMVVSW